MAKYKKTTSDQGKLLPVYLDKQLLPGTFEFTLNHLIDNELDLSVFHGRYNNDETGAPAYDPRILLKIVLFAYSRGISTSRKIAQACRENIVFIALSEDSKPHFTTIADFIATLDREIVHLFRDVLLICDDMGLIGKEMFAIDGCKLPSNAAKEWSGTKADFKKKAAKLEKAIEKMLKSHRDSDKDQPVMTRHRDEKYLNTLKQRVKKIKGWLNTNDDKVGKRGTPIKSNITDNESAKMKTSKGVTQGYDGVTAVDSKHQVIVHAEAFGEAQEHDLLKPMVEGAKQNFQAITQEDIFSITKLSADSGFHSEANMQMLAEEGIDGYVADNRFRKRDPRFADYGRYKERHRKEQAQLTGRDRKFRPEDFTFDKNMRFCICPAGKRMYRSGGNVFVRGYHAVKFKGTKSACRPCHLRPQCLRHPDRTEIRQVAYFTGKTRGKNFSARMRNKIDSKIGRTLYSMRLAVAEPPFAHICRPWVWIGSHCEPSARSTHSGTSTAWCTTC